MTNLSEKFLSNLIQRGYNYVDSGFCVWADWKQEMSSFRHASNNDLLDLSETDINDIIQFVWDQSYTIEKKEKNGHMITCTSPVNVRDAASSQSRVIGELAKGDQVEKLGEDGGWVKIRYQGQEAWVYEDYMSEKNSRKEETKKEKR